MESLLIQCILDRYKRHYIIMLVAFIVCCVVVQFMAELTRSIRFLILIKRNKGVQGWLFLCSIYSIHVVFQ